MISEHEQQVMVMQWARYNQGMYPALRWLHSIPNGARCSWSRNKKGERYSRQAIILKQEGLTPGVSDLNLVLAAGIYHGLFIEMKAETGTPSDEQLEFLNYVNNHGYLGVICYGSAEAIAVLETYLNLEPGDTLDTVTVLDKVHAETPAFMLNKLNKIKNYGGRYCKKVQP
jgi:hypothetical protein